MARDIACVHVYHIALDTNQTCLPIIKTNYHFIKDN